ncbi:MAG: rhomboid family intramembrane serine protease [Stigonema ocellatum SAG 48.90 = DSM 106950]|nr:rhomboid family intramembrane serine protease [Stigonema ocellatum SAG 48.90 = DSM 106950]
MVPISDNILSRRKPIVIYWLIGINIALFCLELKLEVNGQLAKFINSCGIIPALFSEAIATALAGNPAAGIVVLMRSTSLLIGIFLHSSFSQILSNMIFLMVFGKNIEDNLGRNRFLGFYLISGILTGLVQILMEPSLTTPIIGANGAIASILGAYILKFPKAKIDTILPLAIVFIPIELPAYFYLFWWFAQQIFYGIGSLNISGSVNPSHIEYLVQAIGLFIGAAFMRLLQRH